MKRGYLWGIIAATLLASLVLPAQLCSAAHAHDPQDLVLASVGVDERLSSPVPKHLSFTDTSGKRVQLSDYFTGVPVILTLNYYTCPTLCPLVFRNLVDTLQRVKGLTLGKDYRILTVSIDPQESAATAREKSAITYAMLGKSPEAGTHWPFLMGGEREIGALTQSVGVRYTRLPDGEFAHPNVLVVLTPSGQVSRYLYGIALEPMDLKFALLEAAQGKIGASHILNQALLYCFHYDPVGKKYVLMANRVMTGAMSATLLLLSGGLALLWRKEKRNR